MLHRGPPFVSKICRVSEIDYVLTGFVKFEKGVITIRKSKDTQRNCQKINNKRTNNDTGDTIQNTKDLQIRFN